MTVKEEFHPEAERWHWLVQRVGWVLLALGMLLAVLGLFGDGLLTDETKVASSEGIEVSLEYARFARMRSPERIELRINAPGARGALSITLPQDFADAISLEGMTPAPDSTSIEPEGPTYEWMIEDWSSEASVNIDYEPQAWRTIGGDVDVEAGDFSQTVSFSQFVFP